jgi:hypothetical protein
MGHTFRVRHFHPRKSHGVGVTASQYEIRVRGRLGEPLLATFEGFDSEVEPAETILRGAIEDQAALHGLLEQIQALGLELVEVRRVGEERGARRR